MRNCYGCKHLEAPSTWSSNPEFVNDTGYECYGREYKNDDEAHRHHEKMNDPHYRGYTKRCHEPHPPTVIQVGTPP